MHIENTIKKKFSEIIDVTVHIDPVDESGHDDILKLPTRSELLFSLYSAWESIDGSDKIKNIHLHYLEQQVEIDIILPLENIDNTLERLASQLHNKASDIPHIGKINIYYAPN